MGFFRKSRPKTALDAIIIAMYGDPPPEKRANVDQAISLANELLLENINVTAIRQQAVALNAGPIPYSTHDLALAVALIFLKDPTNKTKLNEAQLFARMQALEWLQQGLVAPLFVRSFEDVLYKLFQE